MLLLLPAAASLALIACSGSPEAFPLPPQREFPYEPPPEHVTFIAMDHPDSESFITGGMRGVVEGDGWRWTHDRPEFRFELPTAHAWKFRADFRFPVPNFEVTGPVTVSFFVNGHLLERLRYTSPGAQRYEKPVPAAWLRPDGVTIVAAEIDPCWSDPADKRGEKLGFVLYRVGFVQ